MLFRGLSRRAIPRGTDAKFGLWKSLRLIHSFEQVKTYEDEAKVLTTLRGDLSDTELRRLDRMRNIGISAHIDSGKTTFTERVLFYTGRIKAIHEVRGRDNVGAKMDSMALEREKGITIQSAATFCDWKKVDADSGAVADYKFNLIDTPGHIDFTIEVERALRVLDGAVLVVCAVSGVQSQTITVDRQMRRYNVPRITFINKMDRMGASPWKAIDQIRAKLKINAAAVQVPIGQESDLAGVVDLIHQQALYNIGEQGEEVEKRPIPEELKELVAEKRQELIETLADVDDEIASIFLDEREPTPKEIVDAIRRATVSRQFTPVLMGSALANRGIQMVLDAVCDFLPDPSQVLNTGLDVSDPSRGEVPVVLSASSAEPFLGLAFKLEEGRFGQLTYIRVYQGKMRKGMQMMNVRTGKKVKLARLVRMHSDEMEDVEEAGAGEICATFGIDCSSGDSFTNGSKLTMSSMFVPEPVISLSITPQSRDTQNFSKAINRFQKEDPTFRVNYDAESKETVISGMGELHLEIYVERIRREYNVECVTGKPQVAYRETVTAPATFDYLHKRQSGGAGQYAKVMGEFGPASQADINEFETAVIGGKISEKFLVACEKGFQDAVLAGPLTGHRVLGVKMLINDGATHEVDSSEFAFRTATISAFKDAFEKASPVILEPVMNVSVTAPTEFQSAVIGLLNKREALINDTEVGTDEFTIYAECSLNKMFGFATTLRASTQGKGEFTLEFGKYEPAPVPLQRQLIEEFKKKKK